MVAGQAAADAAARARHLPKLGVGLHLVLTRGRPVSDPGKIPDIVGSDGMFARDLFRAGMNFFFNPAARAQLAVEIRAQFDAFRKTGLKLDHVNGHNHIHLHPTVLAMVLEIGHEFGLAAVRLPYEPPLVSFGAMGEGLWRRLLPALGLWPWTAQLKRRLRRSGFACNDRVFGLYDSGHMTAARVSQFVSHLPEGVSEIYSHPSITVWEGADEAAEGYDGPGEYAALTDPAIQQAIRDRRIARIVFSDLCARPDPVLKAPAH